jgi:hypothetical protein
MGFVHTTWFSEWVLQFYIISYLVYCICRQSKHNLKRRGRTAAREDDGEHSGEVVNLHKGAHEPLEALRGREGMLVSFWVGWKR